MRYRTIWISDVHLGTRQCDADALLAFLDRHDAEYLYLVGDVIDFWSLRDRPYWAQSHSDVLRYWSLSGYLKDRVKPVVAFVAAFERAVAREAARRGLAGVVCGHIHRPALREIDRTLYANCGDWVENCTAIVEHLDGRLELVSPKAAPQTASTVSREALLR